MSEDLNTLSLYIGIVAAALFIIDEVMSWSPCKSNGVTQFIYYNCLCIKKSDDNTSTDQPDINYPYQPYIIPVISELPTP